MTLDRVIFAFAGGMLLTSLLLTQFVSPHFVWFSVFIAVNLLQSAVTGFCPAAVIFKLLGVKPGRAF